MSGPPARGVRLPYADLPQHLHDVVAAAVGTVAQVSDHPSGFSPGTAATVTTEQGRFFVKAVSADANPVSPSMHRKEIRALRALASSSVRAPRLLAAYDEFPWVLMVIDHVPGAMPAVPWSADDLTALVAALDELATVPAPAGLPPVNEMFARMFDGWRRLDADGGPPPWLPLDLAARLAELATLEQGWTSAAEGTALVHGDVRGDNLLLADGHATLVDWPYAASGSPLCDVVLAAPAVAMQGGPPPQEFVVMTGAGRVADADATRSLVAAMTGFLVHGAEQPPPPGLPTLRAFQRSQAEASYAWLRRLL